MNSLTNNPQTLVLHRTKKKKKRTTGTITSYCHDQVHLAKTTCVANLVLWAAEEVPRITAVVILLALTPPLACSTFPFLPNSLHQSTYTQSSKPNTIKPSSVCMNLLEVSISVSNSSSIGSNAPMSRRVLTETAWCSPWLSHTHILPNIHRISFWSYSCDCG